MKRTLVVLSSFLFCLSSVHAASLNDQDQAEKNKLGYVPDQLLVQFNEAVWDFPAGKQIISVQELKNVDRDVANILEQFGVYQVKLQFDVDRVLEKSRDKYPADRWQALAERLPNLRHRYLLYLENPQHLKPLKLALDQSDKVKKTSYNFYEKPNLAPNESTNLLNRYDEQWWHDTIDSESTWDIRTSTNDGIFIGVKVGVVDGGFQEDHTDLSRNVRGTWDPIDGDDDPTTGWSQCDDHGTHVAGIIGAVGNNRRGVVGTFWTGSLYLYRRGESASGTSCNSSPSAGEIAFEEAAVDGVDIINHSYSYNTWLVDVARTYEGTILIVNAAGNDDPNLTDPDGAGDLNGEDDDTDSVAQDFASLTNTLQVANVEQSGVKRTSSDYGAETVHLAAPGTNIWSTIPTNTYGSKTGTSMAAPIVSGVAALVWAECSDLTVQEVREVILKSVTVDTANWDGLTYTEGVVNSYQAIVDAQTACAPDLISSNLTLDTYTGQSGDAFTPTVDIENTGYGDAASFTVSVVFSADATFDTSDTVACSEVMALYLDEDGGVLGLPAGTALSSYALSGCTIPSPVDGEYYVGVIVDSNNEISESDETNNAVGASTLFTVESADSSDDDSDGYTEDGGDCNDADASINPSATETCGDGIDNNCDGAIEVSGFNPVYVSYEADDDISPSSSRQCGYSGNDGDGNIEPGERAEVQVTITNDTDCEWENVDGEIGVVSPLSAVLKYDGSSGADYDWWGSVYPDISSDGSGEFCISVDSTASCDESYDVDLRVYDGDGNEEYLVFPFYVSCPPEEADNDGDGYTESGGDCNDADASINPSATETCGDGIDNNCDGAIEVSGFNPVYVSYEADDDISPSSSRQCGYSGNDGDGNIEPGERAEVQVTITNDTDCEWENVDGEIGVVSPLSAVLKYDGSSGADYDWWGSVYPDIPSDGSGEFCISVDATATCDESYDMDLRVYDGDGNDEYLTVPFYVGCP